MKNTIDMDNATIKAISTDLNDLHKKLNIIHHFDFAPDGAKRFIKIIRKSYDLDLVSQIAGFLRCNKEQIPVNVISMSNEVTLLANSELLKKNIIKLDNNKLNGDYYLSDNPITTILPDTLLTQILGRGSKLDLLYKEKPFYSDRSNDSSVHINTAAVATHGEREFQEARVAVECKKYLLISLLDNSKSIVGLHNRGNYTEIQSVERLRNEELSIFNPTVSIKENGRTIIEEKYDENYHQHLTNVAKIKSRTLYFKISRQNIANSLTTILHKLKILHKNELIHCDLKPQNILCLKEGLTPFDAINVKKGDVSPGMTINYCAPEQILARPVSPATDIYNIGLIILSIIDGVLYGKTSNFIIPSGKSSVKSINILSDPDVYLDYDSANLKDKEGIPVWQSFLRKCLAFEQRNRFQNMDSFINEYIGLLEKYPLKNEIEFQPDFGQISLLKTNNGFETAWIVK